MIVGKKYKVSFSDCCYTGFLIGVLLSKNEEHYIFDTGELEAGRPVSYEEVA